MPLCPARPALEDAAVCIARLPQGKVWVAVEAMMLCGSRAL